MALSASSCTVATICHSPPTFRARDRSPKSAFASPSCSCFRQQWNDMKRHETARHETKRNGFKTERHDCQKRQRNRTVNTVLQNDTERFWKRFFDAYCMSIIYMYISYSKLISDPLYPASSSSQCSPFFYTIICIQPPATYKITFHVECSLP